MFLKNLISPKRVDSASATQLVADAFALAGDLRDANIPASIAKIMSASGFRTSGRAGLGEEFFQYREYSAGDSTAKIDWRKTAKSDAIHVRELELTNPSSYMMVIDNSLSMRFAGRESTHTKLYHSVMLALAIGLLIIEHGDKVKIMLGEAISSLSKSSMLEVAELALSMDPAEMTQSIHPASNYIIFSDFWWRDNQFQQQVESLKSGACNALLVRILDDDEVNFTYTGRVIFKDSESNDEEELGNVEELQHAYKQHFAANEQELKRQAQSANLIFSRFTTNDNPRNFISRNYA